jgi:hypothetical protein
MVLDFKSIDPADINTIKYEHARRKEFGYNTGIILRKFVYLLYMENFLL